mmetsp:Transcript_5928/g.10523  ORF Transcript_5928/g.10523 Transcript_5928/m.10523 type:complete len:92 (-) Transcript_5928:2502-2777(-)
MWIKTYCVMIQFDEEVMHCGELCRSNCDGGIDEVVKLQVRLHRHMFFIVVREVMMESASVIQLNELVDLKQNRQSIPMSTAVCTWSVVGFF